VSLPFHQIKILSKVTLGAQFSHFLVFTLGGSNKTFHSDTTTILCRQKGSVEGNVFDIAPGYPELPR
jgi:hypothetical protein